MRCPAFGSSPVVSVSITISRIGPSPRLSSATTPRRPVAARYLSIPQLLDDCPQPAERRGFAERGRNDKIGAPPLLRIGQLSPQYFVKTTVAHPRAAHHPLALQARRGRDDEHEIAAPGAAGFVQ